MEEIKQEDRLRLNVGWMAGAADAQEYDKKIAHYSQKYGCQQYNFISYPIGGVVRGFWKPEKEECEPPPIDLPDMQLQNHLWETYVNGLVSEWIDCDSDSSAWAELSQRELLKFIKELNYAAYMGLRSIAISLQHTNSQRLARVLNQWMWTRNVNIAIWVFVPSSIDLLERKQDDMRDIWEVWADFRTQCSNYGPQKLCAGIHLGADLDEEFIERKRLSRWNAEPLSAFWFDSSVYLTDSKTNGAVLPKSHSNLLRQLWMSDSCRVLIRGPENLEVSELVGSQYAHAIRLVIKDAARAHPMIADEGFLADGSVEYMDVLQAPLQPLSDNLDSNVYNTFEQDPIKYKRYSEAVEAALHDLGESAKRPEQLVLYVLGAGRGPLMTHSIEAEARYNDRFRTKKDKLKLQLFVVEKNSNAIVTLRYMNQKLWRNRVTVVESDMRSLPALAEEHGYPKPDIIVSELLGSFGDNELSPECLDGVTSFLKPETISIPQSYVSYAAPIMSLCMHQTIKSTGASYWNKGISGHGRDGPVQQEDGSFRQEYPQGQEVSNMDQVYVVYLRQCCGLAEPKPVFEFTHPNFEQSSNERDARVEFVIDRAADVMGIAGYFDMKLYKDIRLSIVPKTFSKGMISWFPALIPLRQLLRVHDGEKLTFCIRRKVDSEGVWYEWYMEQLKCDGTIEVTPVQNKNGDSYYMRLSPST